MPLSKDYKKTDQASYISNGIGWWQNFNNNSGEFCADS